MEVFYLPYRQKSTVTLTSFRRLCIVNLHCLIALFNLASLSSGTQKILFLAKCSIQGIMEEVGISLNWEFWDFIVADGQRKKKTTKRSTSFTFKSISSWFFLSIWNIEDILLFRIGSDFELPRFTLLNSLWFIWMMWKERIDETLKVSLTSWTLYTSIEFSIVSFTQDPRWNFYFH